MPKILKKRPLEGNSEETTAHSKSQIKSQIPQDGAEDVFINSQLLLPLRVVWGPEHEALGMRGFLSSGREAIRTLEAQGSNIPQRLQEKEMDPATCLCLLPEVSAELLLHSFRNTAGMSHVFAQSSAGGR